MNHQKLKCYVRLIDFAKRIPNLIQMLPRGESYIIDQLKRALASAILNLSEGNGRTSVRERSRFFDISLASIAEVSSAIDIIAAYRYIPANLEMQLKSELSIVYAMIFKLKKSRLLI
jgi:four helix bundle protein